MLRPARGLGDARGHAPVAAALRRWDRRTAAGSTTSWPSRASSRTASAGPTAGPPMIYPPVDVARFAIDESPGDYYLVVSALAPYKRARPSTSARRSGVLNSSGRYISARSRSRCTPDRSLSSPGAS